MPAQSATGPKGDESWTHISSSSGVSSAANGVRKTASTKRVYELRKAARATRAKFFPAQENSFNGKNPVKTKVSEGESATDWVLVDKLEEQWDMCVEEDGKAEDGKKKLIKLEVAWVSGGK